MPKLTIDGVEVEVAPGTSVLQACEQIGVEIPRFCYHDKLSVAANCRMCLVEIEKSPKPVASCAQPCADGMVVKTDTPLVEKARKGVTEMLLLNHPLDCPICDQGGECDLQDQAVAYGFDRSRYQEEKRAVRDKDLGPLVKTVMTRCIHCTRCVRFMEEIAGTPEMGGLFRGEHLEITNDNGHPLTSELSGNLADICPVGALTLKPSAFRARPWEYRKTESVDVLDAVGSNIRVDSRNNQVVRILPRSNDDVNEEWISDKTRFAVDGLRLQRLDRPWVRRDGELRPVSWSEALEAVATRLSRTPPEKIAALAGDLADTESLFALKGLMQALGSPHLDCRQDGATYDASARAGYVMNTGIAGIEQADAILLIGTNPRHEAPLVNARLRKRWLRGGLRIGLIGVPADMTYPYQHLGAAPTTIRDVTMGKLSFSRTLRDAKNPMVIVGAGALARQDGAAIHAQTRELAETFSMIRPDWNGFNVLQLAASRVGGLDLGFLPGMEGMATREILRASATDRVEVLYLLGADELDMAQTGRAFVIYQGHHGDRGAHRADVILPGATYTEKDAVYVNTEGRSQVARAAVTPPGEAREDWAVLRALSESVGRTLPFDSLAQLRAKMVQAHPWIGEIGVKPDNEWKPFGKLDEVTARDFAPVVRNFYMTDPVSRVSPTMAQCTETIWPLVAGTEGAA